MKRPRFWLRWLILLCALLVVGEYVALTWVAPHAIMRRVQRALGDHVTIDEVKLSLMLHTMLTGIRWAEETSESAFSVQRAVIRPSWLSVGDRTVWLKTLELAQPALRVTRTKTDTLRWPRLLTASISSTTHNSPWRVRIENIKIEDATIELIDETPADSFHGVLDHLSIVAGPVTLPFAGEPMSFAVRGEFIGHGGYAAPIYCSGWVTLNTKDLQASCQLDPLALAAFEPYMKGPPEIRVYTTMVSSTSQWSARANELASRIQLELGHVTEGDLSIRGHTIIDVKRLTGGRETSLKGEMTLTGPLDNPRKWYAEFLPGDEQVQKLVTRLLDRGVEMLRLSFVGVRLPISLSPSSKATMTDIEAASREVQEALEILAFPPTPETPATPPETAGGPAVSGPAAVTTAPTSAPAEPTPPTPTTTESPAPSPAPSVAEPSTATPTSPPAPTQPAPQEATPAPPSP